MGKRTREQKISDLKKLIPLLPDQEQREAILYLERLGELETTTKDDSELVFNAKSVPGEGRQLRIPMYLESFDGAYYQNSIVSENTNPTVIVDISSETLPVLDQTLANYSTDNTFGHYTIRGLTFSTRQTPWANMRVVGIETNVRYTPSSPLLPDPADIGTNTALGIGLAIKPRILMKNYRVSGSANLFLQEGYIDGTFYSVKRQLFGGLRSYPLLESPKTLKVDIALSGEHYHGSVVGGRTLEFDGTTIQIPTDTTYSVTVSAVVEVLEDANYGVNNSGPYARGESMFRTPPARGQAFISGE